MTSKNIRCCTRRSNLPSCEIDAPTRCANCSQKWRVHASPALNTIETNHWDLNLQRWRRPPSGDFFTGRPHFVGLGVGSSVTVVYSNAASQGTCLPPLLFPHIQVIWSSVICRNTLLIRRLLDVSVKDRQMTLKHSLGPSFCSLAHVKLRRWCLNPRGPAAWPPWRRWCRSGLDFEEPGAAHCTLQDDWVDWWFLQDGADQALLPEDHYIVILLSGLHMSHKPRGKRHLALCYFLYLSRVMLQHSTGLSYIACFPDNLQPQYLCLKPTYFISLWMFVFWMEISV